MYPALITNLIVETFVSVNKNIYIYIDINVYNEYGLLTSITPAPIFAQTLKPTPIPISEAIIASIHIPIINTSSSHNKSPTRTYRKTPIASTNAPNYSPSIASSVSITHGPSIAPSDTCSLAFAPTISPIIHITAPTCSCSLAPSISSTVTFMCNVFSIYPIPHISNELSMEHWVNLPSNNGNYKKQMFLLNDKLYTLSFVCVIIVNKSTLKNINTNRIYRIASFNNITTNTSITEPACKSPYQ